MTNLASNYAFVTFIQLDLSTFHSVLQRGATIPSCSATWTHVASCSTWEASSVVSHCEEELPVGRAKGQRWTSEVHDGHQLGSFSDISALLEIQVSILLLKILNCRICRPG